MPSKTNSVLAGLTEGQALYVVTRLISERRITSSEVSRYANEMDQEIEALESRLHELRSARAFGETRSSPKRRATIRGQYVAMLRRLPVRSREKYQMLSRSNGFRAAVKAMKKALKI